MIKKTCILLLSIVLINCIFCGISMAATSSIESFDLALTWDSVGPPPFVRVFLKTSNPPELMVPLRYMVESSGGVVEWKNNLNIAVINRNTLVVPGDYYCKYNEKNLQYDVTGFKAGIPVVLGQVKDQEKDIIPGVMKNGILYVSSRELSNSVKAAGISLCYPDYQFSFTYWPPVEGPVSSPYGERPSPFGGGYTQFHNGVDIAADYYTPVRSVSSGTVKAGYDDGWGNYVIVRDLEFECHYYHMSSLEVTSGQAVEPGQVLGYVGSTGASTGPHLHFGVKRSLDPLLLQEGMANQGEN
jgi:murein DD-endopeptidase MepM/ murein hydrolase activator NlpD